MDRPPAPACPWRSLAICVSLDSRRASLPLLPTSDFSGDLGGSYFLSKLVGTGKARELYYTAEPLDATQALSLGVVNRVVADADLPASTIQLAQKLARGPRIALALMKQNFNAAETGMQIGRAHV